MSETASWLRRVGALAVDWLTCVLVAQSAVALGLVDSNPHGFLTLGLFIVESTVLTTLAGGSFGKLVTGLRVVRADGSPESINMLGTFIRTLLIALVIPPLIFRPDGRGLHDMAVGTVTVRLADLPAGPSVPR